jgi:nucleotide-binding universal stress UspA family protein
VLGEPGVAEPAIVVVDEYQGRGIGSDLLDALADRARAEGIGCFVAIVLAENDAALAALRRLGETHVISQGPQVEVQIDLEGVEGATPPLRELLRRAAERSVAPAVSFLHRLAVGEQAPDGPRENAIVVACATVALDRAKPLAQATGAAVHVVGTRDEERLAEAVEALRAQGLAAEPHLGRGDLAATLLEVAARERARLLVVDGTRPARERFTLSTWDHVAHHAPCNVLVAR